MVRQYTIEEASQDFASVVEEAEHGARVEVTRGGRTVAVLLRLEIGEVGELKPAGFWSAYEAVRKEFDFEALGINPEQVFGGVRGVSPGRDFSW